MADDGVTTETGDNETSEDAAEEKDESKDASDQDESAGDQDDDQDDDRSDDRSDANTCDECGAPMTSEVADFKISENSRWAEMGGAGEVQYAKVCSNEDCPTNGGKGEQERESESESTDD